METPDHDHKVPSVCLLDLLPTFWCELPDLWFRHFENVITSHKLDDEAKYNLVVRKLDKIDIMEIEDFFLHVPEADKYTALKRHLLFVYKVTKPLRKMSLGDMKPTQLLKNMKDLAGNNMNVDVELKILWISHLPFQIRYVLYTPCCNEMSLDKLALLADQLMEYFKQKTKESNILLSSQTPEHTVNSTQCELLSNQIKNLTLKVDKLERTRRRSRSRSRSNQKTVANNISSSQSPKHPVKSTQYDLLSNQVKNLTTRVDKLEGTRRRSRSRSRSKANSYECWFHYQFGDKAKKCEWPCSRMKNNTVNL